MLGAIPERHREAVPDTDLPETASTGTSRWRAAPSEVAPLEMTKWFDTNYHYLVPEIGPDTAFALDSDQAAGRVRRGARRRRRAPARCSSGRSPSCCWPSRRPAAPPDFEPLTRLDDVLPLYAELLRRAARRPAPSGCSSTSRRWCSTSPPAVLDAVARAYRALGEHVRPAEDPGRHLLRSSSATRCRCWPRTPSTASRSTSPGRAAANLDGLAAIGGLPGKRLVAGVVDGRNVWRTDLDAAARHPRHAARPGRPGRRRRVVLAAARAARRRRASATSTRRSRRWFAFARQKLDEIVAARPAAWPTAATPSPASCASTSAAGGPRRVADRARRRRAGARRGAVTDADRRRAPAPTPSRPCRATGAARPAGAADDHDRLVPADRRAARGRAPTCAPGGSTRPATTSAMRAEIRDGRRSRRIELGLDVAGARRAGTQRHGAVLRRAARPASWPPSTAGCSPTAPGTCGRRSSSATWPGPSR